MVIRRWERCLLPLLVAGGAMPVCAQTLSYRAEPDGSSTAQPSAVAPPSQGANAPASYSSGSGGAAVGEIVVTANRRSESLQKVPLSVSVVTPDALRQQNINDPTQLTQLVPSLQLTNFQGAPGATNFSVRGIGTASFSHLIEPSVATVIDDIVMSRPEMGVQEFSDLTRVEVLNGPQGMLFGKNASAGLVNIVTTRPKLGSFEGFSDASYENVSAAGDAANYHLDSTLNIPIADIAAARITGFYSYQDPLIGNSYPGGFTSFGREEFGGRAKLLIQPNNRLTIYINGDLAHDNGMGEGAYVPRSAGPVLAGIEAAGGVTASPSNLYQSGNAPTELHYDIDGLSANVSYLLPGGATVTDILGYRSYRSHHTIDLDLTQVDLLDTSAAHFNFQQFTNELRLASPASGTLTYQAGLFYYSGFDRRQDLIRGQLDMSVPPPDGSDYWLGLNAQDDLHTDSYAIYGQASYHITDKLTLTAGGRETYDHLHFIGNYNSNDVFISIAGEGNGAGRIIESQDNTNFSWRTSAEYAVTPTVNAYVTVAHGYKGPGFNLSWAGNPGGAPVGPETSMDYEGGLKTTLFGRLLLDATIYWENFTNFQVESFKASGVQGVGSVIIQNAGALRARGVEANFAYHATPQFTFSGSGAFNDAVYTKFLGAPCYVGQTLAEGCIGGSFDASGVQLMNAPRWTGTIAADYRRPLPHGLTALMHLDVYGRTRASFSANNDPNTVQQAYGFLNGSLALAGEQDRWTLRAFCRNCTDKRFVASVEATAVGGAGDYGQSFSLDSFRAVGLALNVRY